jgi:DNA-binding Lrp family transcriptional regulator
LLRDTELRVLIALHGNPLGDVNSLSRQAGISPITFVRSLKKLQTEGLFDKRGFVSSQISFSAVGMELVIVFMNAPQRNWNKIEEMCDNHPYTSYRVRCYGDTNGIFALFAMPTGSLSLLLQLLDIMKKNGTFTDYRLHRLLNEQIYTEVDFRRYNNGLGTWSFGWDGWAKIIDEGNPAELKEFPPTVLHHMTAVDMQVLKQLSMNARKERKERAKEVGIPAYQLSRRLKFYKQNHVIGAYRILFGLAAVNLITPALIECVVDAQAKERIASAASKLPFQGNFIPTMQGFVLYSTLPAPDFPKLADALLQHVDEARLMWCDYASSVRYWFEGGEQSNIKDGKWVTSKELLVDGVLSKIGA